MDTILSISMSVHEDAHKEVFQLQTLATPMITFTPTTIRSFLLKTQWGMIFKTKKIQTSHMHPCTYFP
jgi:hypothetical protein